MIKIGIGLTAALFILAIAAPALATPPDSAGNHKVVVCHATSSETNPYVEIVVDLASAGDRGLKKILGHYEHAANPNKVGGTRGDGISSFTYDGVDYPAYGPYYDGDNPACEGEGGGNG